MSYAVIKSKQGSEWLDHSVVMWTSDKEAAESYVEKKSKEESPFGWEHYGVVEVPDYGRWLVAPRTFKGTLYFDVTFPCGSFQFEDKDLGL